MNRLWLACVLALAAVVAPAPAHAADCTEITTAPATIGAGGRYCLGNNLVVNATPGNTITISSSNVDLGCRGYSIFNNATDPNGNAIYLTNRRNVRGNDIADVESPGNNACAIYGNNPEGPLIVDNAIHGPVAPSVNHWGCGVYLASGAAHNKVTGNTVIGSSVGSDAGFHADPDNLCHQNHARWVSIGVVYCDASNGNY
jgi:hypothetical protein